MGLLRHLGLAVVLLLCVLLASGTGSAQRTRSTYTNPVSKDFADTYAGSSSLKAKDGSWYSYATSGPLREGRTRAIPMVPALLV